MEPNVDRCQLIGDLAWFFSGGGWPSCISNSEITMRIMVGVK